MKLPSISHAVLPERAIRLSNSLLSFLVPLLELYALSYWWNMMDRSDQPYWYRSSSEQFSDFHSWSDSPLLLRNGNGGVQFRWVCSLREFYSLHSIRRPFHRILTEHRNWCCPWIAVTCCGNDLVCAHGTVLEERKWTRILELLQNIIFSRALTSGVYAVVMWVGLAIALAALNNLFGVEIPEKRYRRIMDIHQWNIHGIISLPVFQKIWIVLMAKWTIQKDSRYSR